MDASNDVYSYILILNTLPEINGLPLKVDGWKMNFLLGPGLFLGDMFGFRECFDFR